MVQYTVSARGKPAAVPIQQFIRGNYAQVPLDQIDSFFGFTEPCSLYGGRFFAATELSRYDVRSLYEMSINVRLPLTNHYATPEEYEENLPYLEKYHRRGNSLIITNDELARWIRRDFPGYRLEASVIKNIDTLSRFTEGILRWGCHGHGPPAVRPRVRPDQSTPQTFACHLPSIRQGCLWASWKPPG